MAGGFGGFGGMGGVDLNDIFGDLFGGMGGGFGFGGGQRANPNAPRKGADVRVSLVLGFMEAAHGCTKTITITKQDTCPECSGTGAAKATSPEPCPACGGAGARAAYSVMPCMSRKNSTICIMLVTPSKNGTSVALLRMSPLPSRMPVMYTLKKPLPPSAAGAA